MVSRPSRACSSWSRTVVTSSDSVSAMAPRALSILDRTSVPACETAARSFRLNVQLGSNSDCSVFTVEETVSSALTATAPVITRDQPRRAAPIVRPVKRDCFLLMTPSPFSGRALYSIPLRHGGFPAEFSWWMSKGCAKAGPRRNSPQRSLWATSPEAVVEKNSWAAQIQRLVASRSGLRHPLEPGAKFRGRGEARQEVTA